VDQTDTLPKPIVFYPYYLHRTKGLRRLNHVTLKEYKKLGPKKAGRVDRARAKSQSPEGKAKRRAYNQTPERKARQKARQQTPEAKAKKKSFDQTLKAKAYQVAYRRRPNAKAKDREYYFRRRYGLSLSARLEMFERQKHKCASCKDSITESAHTDHCPKTNAVRALLCGPCNMALGLLKDSPGRIMSLYKYALSFELFSAFGK
jgi:Recombination endonuclease VII